MNFDNYNKASDYVSDKILPHLSSNYYQVPFADFIVKYSRIPAGKWINDDEARVLAGIYFYDSEEFTTKYKNKCITYVMPPDPNDGFLQAYYQISPELIVKATLFVWVEHNIVHSYIRLFSYGSSLAKILKFYAEISGMIKTGNTEEMKTTGFAVEKKVTGFSVVPK